MFRTSNTVLHISMAGHIYLKILKIGTGRIHIFYDSDNLWEWIERNRILGGDGNGWPASVAYSYK